MILTVKIKVNSKGEAYRAVSNLSFEHEIVEADYDGHTEQFDKANPPVFFLRENEKLKPAEKTRNIYSERNKK